MHRFHSSLALLALAVLATWPFNAVPVIAASFQNDIRPILKAHCFDCHGEGKKLRGGLDLRLRRTIVAGGDSGPALVPGRQHESLLFQRIEKHDMPPGKVKLSREQIESVGRWIEQGAAIENPEPPRLAAGFQITPAEQSFWSFQPVRRPPIPAPPQNALARTPIDAFLLARLRQSHLSFSLEADRRTLIRRAYFDLAGFPPAPEEVQGFMADPAPDAYERLIDRLLASPAYGERWGRHWLDVAGYADSEGYTAEDSVRLYAYKYRDYVIRSFNADKPFNQFIQEQLAGDEMVRRPYTNLGPGEIDKLIATGFLRTAPDGTASGEVDQPQARNQVIVDTIKIVSTSLLGLTVGCAQCHNHRYDPIPQTDYYRMRAVFEPAYDCTNWLSPPGRRISLFTEANRRKAGQIEIEAAKVDQERIKKLREYIARTLERELNKLPENLREPLRLAYHTPSARRTPPQIQLLKEYPSVNVSDGSLYLYDHQAAADLKKYADRAAAIRATKPVEEYIRTLTETPGRIPTTHLFNRGDCTQPKQSITPGDLMVLEPVTHGAVPIKDPALATTGRRLAYAKIITTDQHPLTARVLVNRVWMHHFGQGIVATPGDFGALGSRPTHPDLLDWLASDFVAGGWHLKRLHKSIMLSTAYRQASHRDRNREAIDPDNRLLSRMSVRRLEAEQIRDSILAISGRLNPKMFGPPVPIMEDEVGQFIIGIDNKNGENRPGAWIPMYGEEFRRSVYVQVRRSRPLGVLETFDAPTMTPNCEARTLSTVTPQALLLMNSEFIVAKARNIAERVRSQSSVDCRAQAAGAWRLIYGRDAGADELKEAVEFLQGQVSQFRIQASAAKAAGLDPQVEALACLCQTLINSNEFLYVN